MEPTTYEPTTSNPSENIFLMRSHCEMTTLASMQARNFPVISKHISTMVTAKFIQAAKNMGFLQSNQISLVHMMEIHIWCC